MNIKTWRDPYDAGFSPTKPTEITIEPGLTVLVGCNGAGKTTLLLNIKDQCKKDNIPCHFFDNLRDGGSSNIMGSALSGCTDLPCDDMSLAVSMWTASEGEAIRLNIGRQSTLYKEFLKSGYFKNKRYSFQKVFRDNKEDEKPQTNKRVLLFDATDSGLSIDNICDIKQLFGLILEDAKEQGLELYIIISANEYELCRGEDCFDVNKGKYIKFKDYENYRAFILTSRKNKEKRIEKQIAWREKQAEKEREHYEREKTEIETKIKELKSKAENEELTWSERHRIDEYEWKLRDLKRNLRFINVEE